MLPTILRLRHNNSYYWMKFSFNSHLTSLHLLHSDLTEKKVYARLSIFLEKGGRKHMHLNINNLPNSKAYAPGKFNESWSSTSCSVSSTFFKTSSTSSLVLLRLSAPFSASSAFWRRASRNSGILSAWSLRMMCLFFTISVTSYFTYTNKI